MGKEEEQLPPLPQDQPAGAPEAEPRAASCRARAAAALRCVAAVMLGIAVLLSAVFWLPPSGRDGSFGDDGIFGGADVVGSFRLQRPLWQLKENISRLELDIYDEIGVPNATVVVNSLEPFNSSEWSTVIFSVVPYPSNTTLSPTYMSVLKASFTSLVIHQSTLHLTELLFGDATFFEVLRFPGGITIIPEQIVFLPQKPHASFNFTLNFPIYAVQDKTDQLKDQMKSGLLLYPYENLYVKLTNLEGSTVAPPTIVQTIIVLEVGTRQSSVPRMKQLAQTIANSSSGNLGLNHTVFGKVKEISLSSYLQHSLNSRGSSPSPAPQPHMERHHHHPHHHHRNEDKTHMVPSPAPAPSATPHHRHSSPPSGCRSSYIGRGKTSASLTPSPEPVAAHSHPSNVASHHHSITPTAAPHTMHAPSQHHGSPVPSPPPVPLHRASLLPGAFSQSNPPTESVQPGHGHLGMHSMAPTPQTSPASSRQSNSFAVGLLLSLLTIFLLRFTESSVF